MSSTETIVIPILNKKVTLFPGPPIILSNEVVIEKISDEEHSAFFKDASEEIKSSLDLNSTKCIKVKVANSAENFVKVARTKTVFSLNIFADANPVVTSWCGLLVNAKKVKLKSIVEFESLAGFHKISSNQFKLTGSTRRETIINFFEIVNKALDSNSSLTFSMERYNSSLLRDDFLDKLLDATICFETMVPGNTELVHRLSQNIAFIVGGTAAERLDIFNNMKKLYDVRSKLVHGDLQSRGTDRKIDEVKTNWEIFERYLKSAITYYIIFLSQNNKGDWEDHIKELVLGTQNKIV